MLYYMLIDCDLQEESMKSIKEDIKKGEYKAVYLLYGEEEYLKKQYRDRLKKAILPEDDSLNYSYFEGKGISVPEIIDLAETMPFFADRRLIVVENSGMFKSASQEMADYVKTMPDTVTIIFVENEIDKRGRLFKAVQKQGRVVEMAHQDERTLLLWIAGCMKKEKKQIRESTAKYLIAKVGVDMDTLENEMEKLFAYTLDHSEVTKEDVDAICVSQIQNKIFDMVEAVANRQTKRALDYYYDLLTLKEPPMRILFLLTRQFKILLQVKEMQKQHYDQGRIAKAVGLPSFVVKKYLNQCREFSSSQIQEIMEEAAGYEEAVKTGRLKDVLSVELFILGGEKSHFSRR